MQMREREKVRGETKRALISPQPLEFSSRGCFHPEAVKTEITRRLKRNYRAQSAATNNVKTAISVNEKPTV